MTICAYRPDDCTSREREHKQSMLTSHARNDQCTAEAVLALMSSSLSKQRISATMVVVVVVVVVVVKREAFTASP